MELRYELKDEGWARINVADVSRCFSFTCSRLSDALGDMAKAAVMLLNGSREESFAFQDEPGEYRFVLTRQMADHLTLRILRFDRSFSGRADRFGEEVFRCECAVLDFVGQVFANLHLILTQRGLDGYRQVWRNYDFPVRAYEAIAHRLNPSDASAHA